MNLPPPVTKKGYNEHLIQLEKAVMKNAENLMQEPARRLTEVSAEKPIDLEEVGDQKIANVSETVDGTWQKIGHSSKIGVVFVISLDTGKMLYYSVKSLVCHECKARNGVDKDTDEYKVWKSAHASSCQIKHYGSSEEMEAVAATEIFSRIIDKRQLK